MLRRGVVLVVISFCLTRHLRAREGNGIGKEGKKSAQRTKEEEQEMRSAAMGWAPPARRAISPRSTSSHHSSSQTGEMRLSWYPRLAPGGQFNRKNEPLEFCYTKKKLKNWYFKYVTESKFNLKWFFKPKFFLLNCHPGSRGQNYWTFIFVTSLQISRKARRKLG